MSSPVEGVTSIEATGSRNSPYDAYSWFYNPEFQKGIEQGIQTQMNVDNQSHQDAINNQNQIASIWGDPTTTSNTPF